MVFIPTMCNRFLLSTSIFRRSKKLRGPIRFFALKKDLSLWMKKQERPVDKGRRGGLWIQAMPQRANYHTHSRFCDGKGEPEEYVLYALAKGFTHLGFSGHAPLPFTTDWTMKEEDFPAYKAAVVELKERYRDRIEILLGLEVDYIPDLALPESVSRRGDGLEYTLGSVHYLGRLKDGRRWTVDSPQAEFEKGLEETFAGDVRKAVERYYAIEEAMLVSVSPDIIAHFDLIKKNNRNGSFFCESEAWYREAVSRCLEAVRSSGAILEVNTGGIARDTSGALYPSAWILRECLEKDIPILISSDAHRPQDVDSLFVETALLLSGIGFRKTTLLTLQGRRESNLL